MLPLWIPIVAQALQKQQQDTETRRLATARMGGQFAGSMGYPSYGLQGAETEYQTRQNGGNDYLSKLLPLMQQGKG